MATLIRGRTNWDCALTAWQMLLTMGRDELIAHLGHDGEELVDGYYPQAFHMQEFIPVALKAGLRPVYIERIPATEYPSGYIRPLLSQVKFFDEQINTRFGVMECKKDVARVAHAVYFDKGRIYDPSGHEYTFSAMQDFAKMTPIGAYVC